MLFGSHLHGKARHPAYNSNHPPGVRGVSQHRAAKVDDLSVTGLNRLGGKVLLFDSIHSTNAELLARAAELPDGALAWAEIQTAGRGRLGRRWLAPKGSSILLSILLREPPGSTIATLASLYACLAACEAIEASTDCRPSIRWPNDLTIQGRKLGGVLVESTPLAGGARAIVVGIGINCLQQAGHFAEELKKTATSLEIESTKPIERLRLAGELVRRLDAHFAARQRDASHATSARQAWLERCGDRGEWARLTHDGRAYEGVIVDIDAEGNLLVQLNTGARMSFEAATTTRYW